MFPNYCFNKPPAEYSIVYLPTVSRSSKCSLGAQHKKGRSLPPQVPWVSNERLPSVGFRKPRSGRWQCRESRQAAGIHMDVRGCCQKRQQPQCGHCAKPSSSQSSHQESCTNFSKVQHDKLLESLHNTIEHIVSNHFGGILCKIDELSAELQQQYIDMKQLNADVINKINQQSETNLNQFKFIARMLIDDHTLFYGFLNSQRQLSKESWPESNEEQGARKAGAVEYPAQQNTSSLPDQEEGELHKRLQHHLSMQEGMANMRWSKSGILRGKGRRRVATASLPDLRSDALSGQSQECEDPIASLRKCCCSCP